MTNATELAPTTVLDDKAVWKGRLSATGAFACRVFGRLRPAPCPPPDRKPNPQRAAYDLHMLLISPRS